jgi:hypothetical protein
LFFVIFKTSSLIWDLRSTLLYGIIPSILDQIKFIYGSFLLTILYPIAERLCTGWLLIGIALLYFLFRDKKSLMLYFSHFLQQSHSCIGNIKMMHQKIQNRIKKRELFLARFF